MLVHMGEFLVIVPLNREKLIETYPWPIVCAQGGKALLEKDAVDGEKLQQVLRNCRPVFSMSQTNHAQCDKMLRKILISSVAQTEYKE